MTLRLKKVPDQVIVITGASSGIGLATARMAAHRGAKLVLAARNKEALDHLAAECRSAGADAVAVAADVGNEDEVRGIARAAEERFGGFDSWVNDAGGSVYGKMVDIPTADHRRLFDTNFWGIVYGSLEAARRLRGRTGGYAGAIVNLGSEVSDRAILLQGMYSASKHAVKGFTDALRMELEADKAPISVSLVKPTAIDTPFPQHARNYLESGEPGLPPPMYAPEVVAEAILHCCEVPTRDIYAGEPAKLHSIQGALMPRLMDWMMEAFYVDKQKAKQPTERADALYGPTTGLRERGDYRGPVRETSPYTKAEMATAAMNPLLLAGLVAGGGLLAAGLFAGGPGRADA